MNCIGNQLFIFGGYTKGNFSNKLLMMETNTQTLSLVEEVEGVLPDLRAYHK